MELGRRKERAEGSTGVPHLSGTRTGGGGHGTENGPVFTLFTHSVSFGNVCLFCNDGI